MTKKILSLLLGISILLVGTLPTYAENIRSKTFSDDSDTEILFESYDKAIKVIEASYLEQDENGKFTINPAAYDVIDKSIVDSLQKSMNETNDLITSGDIIVKGESLVPSVDYKQIMTLSSVGGVNKVDVEWYGFKAYYDSNECNIKAAQFAQAAAILGGSAGAAAFIPSIGWIVSLPLLGQGTICGYVSAKLWEGNAQGCGGYVTYAIVPAIPPSKPFISYQIIGAGLQ